jgi:hypothetical protein
MNSRLDDLRQRFEALRKDPRVVLYRLHPTAASVLCLVEGLLHELEDQDRRILELEKRSPPAKHFAEEHPLRSR